MFTLKSRKILLLSVPTGAGHIRAAKALKAYATECPKIDIVQWDAMAYVSTDFLAIYTDFYPHLVNRYPVVWGYV
ncbi:MAG: hypothetical protein H7240_08615 [Glaciimonas sp.]|nr:hypothetical protein [Glaciimonas sp.]